MLEDGDEYSYPLRRQHIARRRCDTGTASRQEHPTPDKTGSGPELLGLPRPEEEQASVDSRGRCIAPVVKPEAKGVGIAGERWWWYVAPVDEGLEITEDEWVGHAMVSLLECDPAPCLFLGG